MRCLQSARSASASRISHLLWSTACRHTTLERRLSRQRSFLSDWERSLSNSRGWNGRGVSLVLSRSAKEQLVLLRRWRVDVQITCCSPFYLTDSKACVCVCVCASLCVRVRLCVCQQLRATWPPMSIRAVWCRTTCRWPRSSKRRRMRGPRWRLRKRTLTCRCPSHVSLMHTC